jgi:hypothetical protein
MIMWRLGADGDEITLPAVPRRFGVNLETPRVRGLEFRHSIVERPRSLKQPGDQSGEIIA